MPPLLRAVATLALLYTVAVPPAARAQELPGYRIGDLVVHRDGTVSVVGTGDRQQRQSDREDRRMERQQRREQRLEESQGDQEEEFYEGACESDPSERSDPAC